MTLDYIYYCKIAEEIKNRISDFEPEIGIIINSDMAGFVQKIEKPMAFSCKDIPGFSVSQVVEDKVKLFFGYISGKKIACMIGRHHYYEGYSFEQLSVPVRILKLLGIKKLIITNLAGAINTDYNVGDVMIIKDHINMSGESSLRGMNIGELGSRFPDMTQVYNKDMIRVAEECAEETTLEIRKGVYFFFAGPQFETPAEIRAARILGGDAAGMSTVNEVQTAAHCGLPVLGLSIITNMAAGVLEAPVVVEDVNRTLLWVGPLFEDYLVSIMQHL